MISPGCSDRPDEMKDGLGGGDRKGKRTISEEKLSLLEELLEFKYGKLFEEEL